MKRDLISLQDYSSDEIIGILKLASELKTEGLVDPLRLQGKSVALVFQKSSNRTRVSFEVGVYQLGGKCIYLGPKEIRLGQRESIPDAAKTLSRYLDCIVARTYSHDDVAKLAQYSDIPIINGLSDRFHPCQALTDLLTVKENFGQFEDIKLAYVGDGNNVCNSLMFACAKVGLDISVATPKGNYSPDPEIVEQAKAFAKQSGSKVQVSHSPEKAVEGAHVVYADVWASMGQESEHDQRVKDFQGFQINKHLVKLAAKDYIFMHCLPAHRGEEVTSDVIDGKHSVVFDQAENRLHTQKAVLLKLLGK